MTTAAELFLIILGFFCGWWFFFTLGGFVAYGAYATWVEFRRDIRRWRKRK